MAIRSDDEFRALIEQAHLIEQLTQQRGWPVLVDWLHERMRPSKEGLLNGRIPSHDDYLSTTGYLRGIHEVLDAPEKVAKLVLNEKVRREEVEDDGA